MQKKFTVLLILLYLSVGSLFAQQIPGAAPGFTTDNASPGFQQGVISSQIEKSLLKPADFVFATTSYTFSDLIVFSYFDNTTFNFFNSAGELIGTTTLNNDEYYAFTSGAGVYRVEGSNSFTLLVGDPVSNYVMGYFAVDESGRALSTRLNTYMPLAYGYAHFILFGYEDGTEFTIRDLSSGNTIAAGILNEGEHFQLDDYYGVFLGVRSSKPVSALSYGDQGYFVPATNGLFTGTQFYGFSGYVGGWPNGIIITAYSDNTTYTVTNSTTQEVISSGTLNEGEVAYDIIYEDTYWEVETSNNATVCNTPYAYYSGSYYYLTRQVDESGRGIGTNFYTPVIPGDYNIFSYEDGNEITVYDPNTESNVWTGTLNEGEGYYFYSTKTVYHVTGTKNLSIISSFGGAAGADFMPLNFALGLPDLAVSASDIVLLPDTETRNAGDPITIKTTVHNYGFATAKNVGIRLFDGDPDGGIPISAVMYVDSIQAGSSYTFSFDWTVPTNPAYHAIYAQIDPNDVVVESNGSNNIAYKFVIPNDDLLPPISVSVSSISSIKVEDSVPQTTSFSVTASLFNTGGVEATNVTATINLPSGLSLVEGNATTEFGNMQANGGDYTVWPIHVDNLPAGDVFFYTITVDADNAPAKIIERMIQINKLDPPDLGISLVQNSAFTMFAEIFMTTDIPLMAPPEVTASLGESSADLTVNDISLYNYGCKVYFTASGTIHLSVDAISVFGPDASFEKDFGVQLLKPGEETLAYSPDGDVSLFIPADAIRDEMFMTIFKSDIIRNESGMFEGSEIQFGPTDYVSDKEFVLTFKYDELIKNQVYDESRLKVYYRSATGWVEQETYIDKTNKELVINTSKLGTYKLGEGSVITSVMPQNFVLNQNYPNPFNPVTEIEFTLANKVPQNTELIVYNSLGQKLNTLFSGNYSFGTFKVRWDGTNSSGQKVSSGVYFYQLVSGDQVVSKKMILIK